MKRVPIYILFYALFALLATASLLIDRAETQHTGNSDAVITASK